MAARCCWHSPECLLRAIQRRVELHDRLRGGPPVACPPRRDPTKARFMTTPTRCWAAALFLGAVSRAMPTMMGSASNPVPKIIRYLGIGQARFQLASESPEEFLPVDLRDDWGAWCGSGWLDSTRFHDSLWHVGRTRSPGNVVDVLSRDRRSRRGGPSAADGDVELESVGHGSQARR